MWAWLANFIGRIIKHLIPALLDEARKPRKVKQVGGDNEIRNDIDADIANAIGLSVDENSDSQTP